MNQTSINIIAIAVFTTTIISLLGPLFHLPPAIPAVAMFAFLGLATLDNFTWQGRVSNLFLDLLATANPKYRERILYHEAAHFLVAYLYGIPVTNYALNAWEALKQGQSARGGIYFDDNCLTEELQKGIISAQMLDRYCTFWMAGIAAEILIYGNAEGGAEDRQALRTVLSQLKLPVAFDVKERFGILQAKNVIETNRSAYNALVEAMFKRLSVEECCQAINRHPLTYE
ncbi:MAG: ATP-dependent Zn protease [Oscillatoriaceae bacterium SKW80]|nr:ATP-dependent Zn protease [Oscillatoriaceae bacterium SKYG93]MCX8122425.1 ATP-dependent Zn protease [Oscillatoriaceae bacterium SKW80]MDW8452650.1 ATP-dependent Zn protease [Oscillatoriaceae cyanobacterium SKYGB_i_bin93]HIK28024.1 ATP-dependent Zn protease [Oscillatoriaceae cyanobacterium M7585_C2015_266]